MSRRDAVAAVEGRCPRCHAPRERAQEYCVECGLRLPLLRGAVPALRGRWVRRLGWYPGDWIWLALLTLLVAAGGAAAAIALGHRSTATGETTLVARAPRPAPAAATGRGSKRARTTPAAARVAGQAAWPAGRNGWTIVLFSYPRSAGTTGPSATAARAAHAGLPEVGVIDSRQFASLHPGYYVVFSGVFNSAAEAEAALRSVHAAGFSSAYTRQISR